MGTSLTKARLEVAEIGAFFRPRDIEPLGVSFRQLQGLVAQGTVENLGAGLYRLSEVEPTELETIVMVASAAPNAIVCLLTALRVYEIGTQSRTRSGLPSIARAASRGACQPSCVLSAFPAPC